MHQQHRPADNLPSRDIQFARNIDQLDTFPASPNPNRAGVGFIRASRRTIDSATLTYDDNGNLHINEKSYRFTYDFENRLTKIEIQGSGPGMGPVGGGWQTVATFAYDALG